jgi:hypothetical protein
MCVSPMPGWIIRKVEFVASIRLIRLTTTHETDDKRVASSKSTPQKNQRREESWTAVRRIPAPPTAIVGYIGWVPFGAYIHVFQLQCCYMATSKLHCLYADLVVIPFGGRTEMWVQHDKATRQTIKLNLRIQHGWLSIRKEHEGRVL